MYKEYLNAIDKKTQNYLKKNIIDNINLQFYLNKTELMDKKSNFYFFTHIILHRPENNLSNPINSELYPFAKDLLQKLSKKFKFNFNKIFRICLNLTFNNGKQKSNIHLDHSFEHKNLIIYLHCDDLKSYTCIKKDNKIIKIKPLPNKIAIWNKLPHYHIVPKKGFRLILVYTFI
jgi:hypothetical protein